MGQEAGRRINHTSALGSMALTWNMVPKKPPSDVAKYERVVYIRGSKISHSTIGDYGIRPTKCVEVTSLRVGIHCSPPECRLHSI